jgi:hypothetical protein
MGQAMRNPGLGAAENGDRLASMLRNSRRLGDPALPSGMSSFLTLGRRRCPSGPPRMAIALPVCFVIAAGSEIRPYLPQCLAF